MEKHPGAIMSTIIDACTKELLSWVLSESLEIDFVLETVKQLIEKHGTDLSTETLIHSDQVPTIPALNYPIVKG